MSTETHAAGHDAHAPVVAPPPPEFDKREVAEFGKDDGTAVSVIGKMLVVFFFYSLIVMMCVGYWTYRSNHAAPADHAADSHSHDADEEE